MADVFISYSREDQDYACKLASALHEHGWSVWWDHHVSGGEDYRKIIEHELNTAKSVVVLWSQHSISSEWVQNEAEVARRRGILVTARIDTVEPPLAFMGRQVIDLVGWKSQPSHMNLQPLCNTVATKVNSEKVPPHQPTNPSRARFRWNRRYTVRAVAAMAIVLFVFLVLYPPLNRPLVVLMDSAAPKQVYDPDTRAKYGTNADDLTQILQDLPIRTIKETTNLLWTREQQILDFNPALIIIHFSAFYVETNPSDSEKKLLGFLSFMASSKTVFLMYSKGLEKEMTRLEELQLIKDLGFLSSGIPEERFHLLPMPGGDRATFRDPATARRVKLRVKALLGL